MTLRKNLFLFTAIISLAIQSLHGKEALSQLSTERVVSIDEKSINLAPYVDVLVDPNRSISLADVEGRSSENFSPNYEKFLYYHFTKNGYWFRARILNDSDSPRRVYLINKSAWIDDFRVYYRDTGGKIIEMAAGDHLPYNQRYYHDEKLIFPVSLAAHEEKTVFMRVRSFDATHIPLFLLSGEALRSEQEVETMMVGAILGIFLVMALYNFLLFTYLRDKVYLLYSLYVIFFGMMLFSVEGFAFRYLWPNAIWWNERAYNFFFVGYLFFIILFIRRFLETKTYSPVMYRVLGVVAWVYFAVAVSTFFISYPIAMQLGVTIATVIPFVMVVPGIFAVRDKAPLARFYLAGWFPNAAFYSIWALGFFGILPVNSFTLHANSLGALFEFVIFSLALAYRVDLLRRERERAESKMVSTLDEVDILSVRLEAEQRTFEERVKARTAELEKLSVTDGLTGLYNRYFFNETFSREFERSRREKQFFYFYILDLDNFKEYNDTYGHQAGDEALVKVAHVLERHFQRQCDLIYRLGGEEFGGFLCGGQSVSVEQYLQKLIGIFAEAAIPHSHSKTGYLTISVGAVVLPPECQTTTGEVYRTADKALYESKRRGKNQVHVYTMCPQENLV